jgi:hypothetical protein
MSAQRSQATIGHVNCSIDMRRELGEKVMTYPQNMVIEAARFCDTSCQASV